MKLLKFTSIFILFQIGFISGQNYSNPMLQAIVYKDLMIYDINRIIGSIGNLIVSNVECMGCQIGVGILKDAAKSEIAVKNLMTNICNNFQIQTPFVCQGVANLFGPHLAYIMNNTKAGSDEICNFVLGDPCGDIYNVKNDWNVTFPPITKPTVVPQNLPTPGSPTLKVLHIADIHVDPEYEEGANNNCKEPMCCRKTSSPMLDPKDSAGMWGSYGRCEVPARTFDDMLNHITTVHNNLDYVIFTGDIPPHDVWNVTSAIVFDEIRTTMQKIKNAFPNLPIYPVIGNHEPVPINNYPLNTVTGLGGSQLGSSSLFNELNTIWRMFLPADTVTTILKGAYYTVLVKPGFRIVSLNSNFCYNLNWWLLIDSVDPAGMLQWLITVLQNAENAGEKVHIISHIPPGGHDCLKAWSRNYNEIINRYEGTVMAQFYGHTHNDEFEVQYDMINSSRPISVNYIGPSVTTWTDLNPGYRIYYVDGDYGSTTRTIVDHESWVMDLNEANFYGIPYWYKLYSAKSAYNMAGLRPQDWDDLIKKMASDIDVFNLYYNNYYKNSIVKPVCDDSCRRSLICDTKSGRSHVKSNTCQSIDAPIRDSWANQLYKDLSKMFMSMFGSNMMNMTNMG